MLNPSREKVRRMAERGKRQRKGLSTSGHTTVSNTPSRFLETRLKGRRLKTSSCKENDPVVLNRFKSITPWKGSASTNR